jgi:arsenite methyltransferase
MTPSITEAIKQRYGSIASNVGKGPKGSESLGGTDPITRDLYVGSDLISELPKNAVEASLGCGNPTAMVKILPGQTVLDLGSGNSF